MEEFVARRTVQGGKVGGGFRLLDTSMQKKNAIRDRTRPVLILWQSFHTVMYQYKATYYKEYIHKPTIDRTDGIDF